MWAMARDAEALDMLVDGVQTISADVTESNIVENVLCDIRPDVLVLKAGAVPFNKPIQEQTWEQFNLVWNTDAHASLIAERTRSINKQRTDTGLRYALYVAVLSLALTVAGVVAALWYIAWWEAVLFIVVVLLTGIVTLGLSGQLVRPESEEDRELGRRFREERERQQRIQAP